MAYDEHLADRVRAVIGPERGLSEKQMFGGLAFLVNGNMSVAVSREGGLLLHVDTADTAALLAKPFAKPMVMRGRSMSGWLRVDAEGVRTAAQLRRWVERSVGHARSLPPKRKARR